MAAPEYSGAAFVFPGRAPARCTGHMTITVNGQVREVPDGLSVEELLAHLNVKREYTAVAINREVTPRSAHGSTFLSEGDRVEIVRPMGGG